jgi:hypothetical protein
MITDYQFIVFPLVLGLLAMMAVAYGANWCRDRYVPAKG